MSDDVINGGELIEMNYPKTGPHSPELIESAGSALYELVRFLNYATLPEYRDDSLPYASRGYRVCGSLRGAADLQQQLYGQLGQWCDELASDPALGHADHGGEEINHIAAVMNAEDAAQAFRAAIGHVVDLADALSKAQTALSLLYHHIDDEEQTGPDVNP
jgi:hypothetical protein